MMPAPGSLFLMIGDSVTDCGRTRPVGLGALRGLGDGYVACVDALWRNFRPASPLRIANLGISGDTVRHLAARWTTDVIALRPDWLSVMIGINDVWRQFESDPQKQKEAVSPEEYAETYDRLITAVRPGLQGLVLLTPFHIQPDMSDPMRIRMDQYGALVRKLALRHGAVLIDTQQAFDNALRLLPPGDLSEDRVHPSLTGHMVLARAFLGGLGLRLSLS